MLWKHKINNFPLLHFYTFFEFTVLILFFSHLKPGRFSNKQMVFTTLLFLVICLIDAFVTGSIYTFNTYSRTTESLVIILLCLSWFINTTPLQTRNAKKSPPGSDHMVRGFLIYFSGALVFFAFGELIDHMRFSWRLNLWSIHSFLVFQLHIFILIGLWKAQIR